MNASAGPPAVGSPSTSATHSATPWKPRPATATSCTGRPWPTACAIGLAARVTPSDRAARLALLLDRLELAVAPLPYSIEAVLGHLATDKKHADGRLRWVLPTADGVVVRDDIDAELVERAAAGILATNGSSR